ncbi:uncharacterized protein [Diabrotica undecimpunctata]|uniref:uncharacterized protein isoform X2 n=1 Tax=Diabrotica undecimpunctata TaxID=50387 RepID=UPI003B6374A4
MNPSQLTLLEELSDLSDIEDPTYRPDVDKLLFNLDQHIHDDDMMSDNVLQDDTADAESNQSAEPNRINKERSRKRKKDINEWKQNVRKRRRQAGLDYINTKGEPVEMKSVKGQCDCRLKCNLKISIEDQTSIHKHFWQLEDQEKSHFYSKFVQKTEKNRSRPRVFPQPQSKDAYKKYTLKYFFELNNNRVQVCKTFFLNTLHISSRRISYFFENKYQITGTPKSNVHGKHVKRVTSGDQINKIKEHINSFPRMESHYCRANTSKEYLEQDLTLQKMFDLYKEKHPDSEIKINVYRNVFNTSFNISFFKPKKDRCDFCEEIKNSTDVTDKRREEFQNHVKGKEESKMEKNRDRETVEENTAFISFDLQNVYSLPKANVSNFFYKRKFSVYNLTGYCSKNKKTYCGVWHEMISGRTGNHICSSLLKILDQIVSDFPELTKLVIWSDSCIPQNRNSIMTFGLQHFIKKHPQIQLIQQKFSEPGDSNVQEVDAVHSLLERKMRYSELYSPVSLLRTLVQIASHSKKIIVLQMKPTDFLNFQILAKKLGYSKIPYTKVKFIEVDSSMYVSYKTSFTGNLSKVRVDGTTRNQRTHPDRSSNNTLEYIVNVKQITQQPSLEAKKKADIISMLKYMPQVDKQFYELYIR